MKSDSLYVGESLWLDWVQKWMQAGDFGMAGKKWKKRIYDYKECEKEGLKKSKKTLETWISSLTEKTISQ